MRRMVTAATLAGLVAVLPGCGNRTNEAARAAGMVPGNAIAFVSASLDPSIAQKKDLLQIAQKFPKARDKVRKNFQETRDTFLVDAVKQACLDYQRDVKPWLGSELAVAALPRSSGKGVDPVLLIKVKDETKARKALETSFSGTCKTSTVKGKRDFRMINGFAVIASGDDTNQNAIVLDDVARQAKSNTSSLAKTEAFTTLESKLHGDRLVFGYVDAKQAVAASGGKTTGGNCDITQALGSGGSVAFDLHVESAAVVLEGIGNSSSTQLKTGAPKLTQGLPASTTGAFTVFDVASVVRTALQCTGSQDEVKRQLSDQTGLDLDADVLSWMGGESVVVSGPFNSQRSFPDFALVVEPTDQQKAGAALSKIKSKLTDEGNDLVDFDVNGTKGSTFADKADNGIQPAMVLLPDRFIIATSPDFVKALAAPASPSLGSTASYKNVVGSGSGDGTQSQLVVNIAAIKDAIVKNLSREERAKYDKDVAPEVDPLDSFGLRLFEQDGFSHIEVKLTLK